MAFSSLEALQAFGLGAQMRQQQALLARRERELDRQEQTRAHVSEAAGRGDYRGAMTEAIGGGDYDLAKVLGDLDEHNRAQTLQQAQIMGRAAQQLKGLPAEQRASAYQQLVPILRNAGFQDEQLSAADLSDQGLDGYINMGASITSVLSPPAKPPEDPTFVRELRAAGIDPASPEGVALLNNRYAPAPRIVTDPATGQMFVMGGGGGPGGAPQSSGPQPGQVVNGYRFKGGNPNDRNAWEPVQGGASQPGSQTFP